MGDVNRWSLITFQVSHLNDQAGILRSDGRIVQPGCLRSYAGLIDAMRNWAELEPQLRALDVQSLESIDSAIERAPLCFPNKLICAGANYKDHLAEMGAAEVPEGCEPFFFLLPGSTTLIASGEPVRLPVDPDAGIDWEAELAVVIGRRGANIPVERAVEHVAGYACFNDITARNYLRRHVSIAPPFMWDWTGAKGLDSSCPMGPITPSWAVPDPHNLGVHCSVNGELKQNGNSSEMVFSIWRLIAHASRFWTLEPGDVIATGTPAGVGARTQTFLKHGDIVRVEIDGLAPLENPIQA